MRVLKTLNILTLSIFIIISNTNCNKSKTPLEYEDKEKLINYIPLKVGNSWTYKINIQYNNSMEMEEHYKGDETWEIIYISEDSSNFTIRSTFNGISYSWLDNSYDSVLYVNTIELMLVEGPYSYAPSLSMIQNKIEGSGTTGLQRLIKHNLIYYHKYLEIAFPFTSDSCLVIHQYDESDNNYYSTLDYTIQKNQGILDIDILDVCGGSGGTISCKLLSSSVEINK